MPSRLAHGSLGQGAEQSWQSYRWCRWHKPETLQRRRQTASLCPNTAYRTAEQNVPTATRATAMDTQSKRQATAAWHPDTSFTLHLHTMSLEIRICPGSPDHLASISQIGYSVERRLQRLRSVLRSAAMISGVRWIHQGLLGLAWIPSRRPDLHQSQMVEMVTFNNSAATWAG